jgi:hypothetical protein
MAAKAKPAGAPANPHRGEISVTLGGADYVLRPTFEAMVAIEEQIGSLIDLAAQVESKASGLTIKQLSVIVGECIKAHGRETGNKLTAGTRAEVVAKMIYETGLLKVYPVLGPLLTAMLTGGAKATEGNG